MRGNASALGKMLKKIPCFRAKRYVFQANVCENVKIKGRRKKSGKDKAKSYDEFYYKLLSLLEDINDIKIILNEYSGLKIKKSAIHKYQDDYYKAINNCNHNVESTEFVEFMLNMIDKVLDEAISTSSVPITETGININKLLSVMEYNVPMTANEIMDKLGIKSKETLRSTYLDPAIKEGVVALTIPDKPTSKNQMYYRV